MSQATTGPVPTGQNNAIVTGKYTEPLPTASPETKNINYIVIICRKNTCISLKSASNTLKFGTKSIKYSYIVQKMQNSFDN